MRTELREDIMRVGRFMSQAELAVKLEGLAEGFYKSDLMTSQELMQALMEIGKYKAKTMIAVSNLAEKMTLDEANEIDDYLKGIDLNQYFIQDVTDTIYAILGKERAENVLNKVLADM